MRNEQAFDGIEMKVEITNFCLGGRCKFCSPLFRPTVEEAGSESFLRDLDQHLETYLTGGGKHIILTGGGEPIDAPAKLFGALRLIKDKQHQLGVELELLTIYSNGVGLLKQISSETSETYLDRLASLGVQDINLSLHGLTQEERTAVSGEAMGSVDFGRLIPQIVQKGIRVMTRTALTRGSIDSVEKAETFVRWMVRLGVGIVYFSDLFTVPIRNERTTPGSQTVLRWTDEHRVNFDALVAELKLNRAFEFMAESSRHNHQGRTMEFRHRESGLKVLFGDLVIGNESDERPTYGYVKPDGSMAGHNNARDATARKFLPSSGLKVYLQKYRPGRDDL